MRVAFVIRDYEVLHKKLHFTLIEDTYQPEQDKRWVVVARQILLERLCYSRERPNLSKKRLSAISLADEYFYFSAPMIFEER